MSPTKPCAQSYYHRELRPFPQACTLLYGCFRAFPLWLKWTFYPLNFGLDLIQILSSLLTR